MFTSAYFWWNISPTTPTLRISRLSQHPPPHPLPSSIQYLRIATKPRRRKGSKSCSLYAFTPLKHSHPILSQSTFGLLMLDTALLTLTSTSTSPLSPSSAPPMTNRGNSGPPPLSEPPPVLLSKPSKTASPAADYTPLTTNSTPSPKSTPTTSVPTSTPTEKATPVNSPGSSKPSSPLA